MSIKVKYRSFAVNFTQLYHMFHRKCYQENWDKSQKLVGQMLELVGHYFVPLVTQLKYALCGWVCYHDNSKLRASILTKLGL